MLKKRTIATMIVIVVNMLFLSCPAMGHPLDITRIVTEMAETKSQNRLQILTWRMEIIKNEFSLTRDQAIEELQKALPNKDEKALIALLDDSAVVFIELDGEKRYFESVARNILFRNTTLMREKLQKDAPFVDALEPLVFASSEKTPKKFIDTPYTEPLQYKGNLTIDIEKTHLPQLGIVDIWVPVPILTDSQKIAEITSVYPEKFSSEINTEKDIGFIHFAIPMEEIQEVLKISVDFNFTHYQQHFDVNAEKILPYNKETNLYKQYTRSLRNTFISDSIAQKAREIVGSEKNPYLQAQKIYNYIIENIPYSFVPHGTLQILGIPESKYIHEQRHGDCGTQSIYFSALCRSLGIPARTTGGYQAIPGHEGTHFWAEFYIEGYGWIPVDTTVADTADWTGILSEEKRQHFKKFFFGNLDAYRFVIQKDVDLPVYPEPKERIFSDTFPLLVLQTPLIAGQGMKENPIRLAEESFSIKYYPVKK
jgi:hypothetical protein